MSDQNAYALGGIAGHAGLFSTVGDIHKLASRLLTASPDDPLVNSTTVHLFTKVGAGKTLIFTRSVSLGPEPFVSLLFLSSVDAQPDTVKPRARLGHQRLREQHVPRLRQPLLNHLYAHG